MVRVLPPAPIRRTYLENLNANSIPLNAIIDGDIIKYRCAFAAEKSKYLVEAPYKDIGDTYSEYDTAKDAKKHAEEERGSFIWHRKDIQPVSFALQAAKTSMEAITGRFAKYVVYVSGPTNFRTELAVTKPYKGNRDRNKDPIYKNEVEEYLIREYGAIRSDGIEADDSIGIALTSDPAGCAVTIDKDLDQIPGWHYNWVTGQTYKVGKREADFALYAQLLSGDATDNIPGLEGIGTVKARNLLDGSKSSLDLAQRTWSAYRERVDGYEAAKSYFIEQLNLVYVLRKPNDKAIMYLPTGFSFD